MSFFACDGNISLSLSIHQAASFHLTSLLIMRKCRFIEKKVCMIWNVTLQSSNLIKFKINDISVYQFVFARRILLFGLNAKQSSSMTKGIRFRVRRSSLVAYVMRTWYLFREFPTSTLPVRFWINDLFRFKTLENLLISIN